MTLQERISKNTGANKHKFLRLGQKFIIEMGILNWPELFYEENDVVAIDIIGGWCGAMQYTYDLPIKEEVR